MFGWRPIELLQTNGQPFSLCQGSHLFQSVHHIDRATGGGGTAALDSDTGSFSDPDVRRRLRIKTLMDEAAESCLIEGASTTRKDAVELLREGRSPSSIAERMVHNNYVAMQSIKQRLDRPLSPEMLIDLQRTLTAGTLEKPDECGRLRRSDESVRVEYRPTNETIHTPPSADELPSRLKQLCAFANASHDRGPAFLHPVVKACILHFMVGYEHPFCDGNGRTARAVFYWFALRHNYSIFEYTAISELIRSGFARYPQAYVDCELDEGDLTYFVLYKLDIIEKSLEKLYEHIRAEDERIKRSQQLLKLSKDMNLRQRLLLEHSLRHPQTNYTVKSHGNSNGVAPATARADLRGLVKHKLLITMMRGKEEIYMITPGLADRLERRLKKSP